jgi:hypothetical protein
MIMNNTGGNQVVEKDKKGKKGKNKNGKKDKEKEKEKKEKNEKDKVEDNNRRKAINDVDDWNSLRLYFSKTHP